MNRIVFGLLAGLTLTLQAAEPVSLNSGVIRVGTSEFNRATAKERTNQSILVRVEKNAMRKHIRRAAKPQARPKHNAQAVSDVSVFDAQTYLVTDLDGDGFYREFELVLDLDTYGLDREVYLKLYYRSNGSDWLLLDTSSPFWISGQSSQDAWQGIYTLTSGFRSDWYEIAVDVYDAQTDEWLVTVEGSDDLDLYDLPLEDRWADGDVEGFALTELTRELSIDDDLDGFYQQFYFDVLAQWQGQSRRVHATLYSRGSDGQWYREATSVATLLHDGDNVRFVFDGGWQSGYPTDYYDFLIDLVDADTGAVLMTVGPENVPLSQAPMESADWDEQVTEVVVTTTVGGSMGLYLFGLLGLLGVARRVLK